MRCPQQASGPRRDGLEARLDLDALEQERGDVGRQRRFSAALLGLLRTPASASREPLTLIAVTRYTASATQFSESARRSVCVGGRNSQLKASMLTIDTGIANGRPQIAATGSTAKR